MKHKYFEWVLYEFMAVTGLPETEIVDIVEQLPISYEEALNFYKAFGRWPEPKEAWFIYEVGCDPYWSVVSSGITLSK